MKVIAGVDGGGTSTIVEIWNEKSECIQRRQLDSMNLNSIGEEKFRYVLRELFQFVNSFGECMGICIGAAGVSNPNVGRLVEEETALAGYSEKLILKGDHEVALYGAGAGEAGCLLIGGTGSICIGRNQAGNVVRVGGFGHLIDDNGSGYAIGRDALSAVVQAYDGRGKETVLTQLMFDYLSISHINDLISYVYSTDKSSIASLSKLVEEAGRMGDEIALEVLAYHGYELSKLVQAVCRLLKVESIPLYLMGGLLVHDTLVKKYLQQDIMMKLPSLQIKKPQMDAAQGAALIAACGYTA